MVFMRLLILAAVLIAATGSLVTAQEKTAAAPNTVLGVAFAAPGCEQIDKTTIDCSMMGTSAGKDASTVLTIQVVRARVFVADGSAFVAIEFSGRGVSKVPAQANVVFPRNIPVRLTFWFRDVPASLTTLRGFSFETVSYENTRVNDQPKSALDAVTTTALVALPKRTSAPVKFNIALSDCVANETDYACTVKLSLGR